MNSFEMMNLFPALQQALTELNYKQPTPIQSKSIPPALEGLDVLGCAKTGTGKTAAFVLPILDFLGLERPTREANRPSVLVLVPTRELAIQIAESIGRYGKHMKFRHTLVYGGVRQDSQTRSLRQGVDIVIATPGRLLDLLTQRHIDLRNIQMFVLDEADQMLDMGFLPALKKVVAALPEERQSLFFSATLPPKIRDLAAQLLFNPVTVTVNSRCNVVERISQSVRFVQRGNKLATLSSLLSGERVDRTIVFTRTKHAANGLAKKLSRAGFRVTAIHGNKTQNARQRALEAFRREQGAVLVATDVAARGIDVPGVTHVVNYDMPGEPDSYIHRIGRTGRAGANGIAVSFCTPDELDNLRAIEKHIGIKLQVACPNDQCEQTEPALKTGVQGNESQPSRSIDKRFRPKLNSNGQRKLKIADRVGAASKPKARHRHQRATAL
ncbi:MAG: DEAD/DEAH box helicase [Planctomycetales bacterium]|nr:DEAD/DEAH box helicase [Planctomycetales bacterium]